MEAILLAAGSGERMCSLVPKQFLLLNGSPMIDYSINVLTGIEEIEKIFVVLPAGYTHRSNDKVKYLVGGSTRQESVRIALQYITTDYVLIHEAARPFATREFVKKIVDTKSLFTLPYIMLDRYTTFDPTTFREIPRRRTAAVQLPQLYRTSVIKDAHIKAMMGQRAYTDDATMVMEELRVTPTLVEGLEENIKVTYKGDLL
jgi:2-C-methyl-D-erythritol 4-phosphate cytidylyltransferase